MTYKMAEHELAQFLVNLETATWNKLRSNDELKSFIDARLERIAISSEVSLS